MPVNPVITRRTLSVLASSRGRGSVGIVLAVTAALVLTHTGNASVPLQERELAERYAPVVRLVEQTKECGSGEPYEPIDVERILGNKEVILRGGWDTANVVKVAPTARDLAAAPASYYLDFPGQATKPGCDYEDFSRRVTEGSAPTTYARVVTEPGKPGKLALQYWFYYVFNDFNNKHESDWEMIQIVFDADDAAEALATQPSEVGYSQHEGAERAEWGAGKLELVGGTHPVVYPAAGSHANYFDASLHLGRSAQQGIGCDNTNGSHRELRPHVVSVPSDMDAHLVDYPWLGYTGHWGELRSAAEFTGPTGPNTKDQWTAPMTWAEDEWRSSSATIPGSLVLFQGDTASFYCGAVRQTSKIYSLWKSRPELVLFGAAVLVAFVIWAASRTRWRPAATLRLARRRTWGQIVAAGVRMPWERRRFFLGLIGASLLFPVVATASSVLANRVSTAEAVFDVIGTVVFYAVFIFTVFVVLVVMQLAVALGARTADRGGDPRIGAILRETLPRLWTGTKVTLLIWAIAIPLSVTVVGIPVALYLLVRWALALQVVALEPVRSARAALSRSARLVRGRSGTALTLVMLNSLPTMLMGPLVGSILILALGLDFEISNLIASVVVLALLPLVAMMKTYLYYDGLVRAAHRQQAETVGTLPAELDDEGGLVTT